MAEITVLDNFRVPLGNQEIELQQIDHVEGGMPLMRIRIREARRFTIFDIDPITARHWAKVMQEWAAVQLLIEDEKHD
jgi:nicotinamide riboside kinase